MEHKSNPPPYTEYPNPTAPIYPTIDHQVPVLPMQSPHQPQLQQPMPVRPQAMPLQQSINVSVGGGGGVHTAGHCPVCNGSFTATYPCLAWLCCICCFPCGIICCCCMKKKKCSKCGMIYG